MEGRARSRKKKVITSRCSTRRQPRLENWQKRRCHEDFMVLPRCCRMPLCFSRERTGRRLVRPDDPSFPLVSSYAGMLPRGDPDLGVPVGQLFFPPYLFKPDGTRAARPVIETAPIEISYRGHFDITVAGRPRQISSVVMLRSDHNTHSLTTGDRYVKMAFHHEG